MAQGIFRNRSRFEKLQEIIRAAGFRADAGEFQAAERLAFDNGAGDAAIDVKIADAKLFSRLLDMRRRARKDTAGQVKLRVVGDGQRLGEILRFDDRQNRAKNLFLGDAATLALAIVTAVAFGSNL